MTVRQRLDRLLVVPALGVRLCHYTPRREVPRNVPFSFLSFAFNFVPRAEYNTFRLFACSWPTNGDEAGCLSYGYRKTKIEPPETPRG